MGCASEVDIRHGTYLVGPLVNFAFFPALGSQCDAWQLSGDTYLCGRPVWRFLEEFLEQHEEEYARLGGCVPLLSGLDRCRLEGAEYALVIQPGPPSESEHDVFEPIRTAVLALRLVADGPLYANPVVSLEDGQVKDLRVMLDRPVQHARRVATDEVPAQCACLKESHLPLLRRVVALAQEASEANDNRRRIYLALRFYELSWRHVQGDIRAVLLWSALEALFRRSRGSRASESAKCAAVLLTADSEERETLASNFEELRRLRNRVLHEGALGSNKRKRKEALPVLFGCQERLRQLFVAICKCGLQRHYLSKEHFAAWVRRLLEEYDLGRRNGQGQRGDDCQAR